MTLTAHAGTRDSVRHAVDLVLRQTPRPTAFFVFRTADALVVAGHLTRRGVGLPGQAGLICRDDAPYLGLSVPSIACYHLSPVAFARRVYQLLRKALLGANPSPTPHLLTPVFQPGETLG